MKKHWILNDSKNKIVICTDDRLYFGTPKGLNDSMLESCLKNNDIPKDLFSLPFSYMRVIQTSEAQSKIIIKYNKDSEEEIVSEDSIIKNEIFDHIKIVLPSFKYEIKKPSVLTHVQSQVFALLIPLVIYIWVLYLAIQIENGFEYEVIGGNGSLTGLVLGIAQFGSFKISVVYIVIFILGLFSLLKRIKSVSLTRFLKR